MRDAHVGSLTCSYVGDASLTPIPMRCFTIRARSTVSLAKEDVEASVNTTFTDSLGES